MADPFIGEITMFGGSFAPSGWAFCDGQLLTIAQNTALFSLFGALYGGDGRTTFALPDLRGRIPLHKGQGPGLTNRRLGEKLGSERVILLEDQIPRHSHSLQAANSPGASSDPNSTVLPGGDDPDMWRNNPTATVDMATGLIDNAGRNVAHTNIQPFQVVNFIVALIGLDPS